MAIAIGQIMMEFEKTNVHSIDYLMRRLERVKILNECKYLTFIL